MTGMLAAFIGCGAQNEGGGVGFNVTAAPAGAESIGQTSPVVTATPHNGAGPYTYSWTIDNPVIRITSPTANATTFFCTGHGEVEGNAKCTVEDTSDGKIATSNNVDVLLNLTEGNE